MNSRSGGNESSLVNFSPDLASLNALDKEPLLSFPFDHLYACHSQSTDLGQSLTLDKNVEISTHCLVQPDQTIQEKDAEILSLKTQNKKLKELLVYHLDLIQQQNDLITNREKSLTTVQHEIDNLRVKTERPAGKHLTLAQRHLNPPPLFNVPTTCTVTSASHTPVNTVPRVLSPIELPQSPQPVHFNTIEELLGKPSSLSDLYTNDRPAERPFVHDPFDLNNPAGAIPELPEFLPTDLPSLLDSSPLTPIPPEDFNMIDRLPQEVQPPVKKEPKYTITTNSGIPIIHKAKNRKRPSGIGSLSRMPKKPKTEPTTIYDNEIFSATKKEKLLSTFGKNKINPLRYPYAGSLSDRLQLIDTTPTGEDPYQLGEAEMREQSPIPRLVLPKHNRVRVHTGEGFALGSPATVTPSRRIYDPDPVPQTKPTKAKKPPKPKTSRRKSGGTKISTSATTTTSTVRSTTTSSISHAMKKEDVDWEPFSRKRKEVGDFSYSGQSLNLTMPVVTPAPAAEVVTPRRQLPSTTILSSSSLDLYSPRNLENMDITKMSYKELFDSGPPGEDSEEATDMSLETVPEPVIEPVFEPALQPVLEPALQPVFEPALQPVIPLAIEPAPELIPELESAEPKTKKRGARTTSVAGSSTAGEEGTVEIKRAAESKRGGRKRALSSASSTKREKAPRKPRAPRGRGGYRGKRGSWIPVAPLTTRKPYHTAMGHPDISWYLGHDPEVKKEDVDQLAENTASNVEVPRWREMTFTSLENAEGTENTEDEAYRKRHQKLEAEERRQLRWHMRRVREQRHVERLRLRQRDPWNVSTHSTPPTYTVWPSPLRDLQLIEITDILPVLAFGEDIPKLPEVNFVLPWVRSSKPHKRSKRSKTLH